MNSFVRHHFERQIGVPSNRVHAPVYLPESSFDALAPSACYKFLDVNLKEAPPLTLSISGERIASANDAGDVALLNKHTLAPIIKFSAHNCAIFDFKWRDCDSNGFDSSVGARQFLTCSGDRSIALWDAERTDYPISTFIDAHLGSVKSLSFHDYNLFASSSRDGTIKFWDIRSSNASTFKCGPLFCIEDPHIHRLPSVKSPRAMSSLLRSTKAVLTSTRGKQSPIASANRKQSKMILPSNVVTCVAFDPTYNTHLYSSGIADSTIKVWDIRRCRRQYQCAYKPSAVKCHSINNCYTESGGDRAGVLSSRNGHGFSSFIFSRSPKYGNVLLASATDSRVYAFANESTHPLMIFSGRCVNNFSRLATLGDRYLLSGSSNGRVLIWNSEISLPTQCMDRDHIAIENRFPLYELSFDDHEDISLVAADTATSSIYNSSDMHILYKWNFARTHTIEAAGISAVRRETQLLEHNIPRCVKYSQPNRLSQRKITINRPSNFASVTTFVNCDGMLSKKLATSTPIHQNQPHHHQSRSSQSSSGAANASPLGLITNWIHNVSAPEISAQMDRLNDSGKFKTPISSVAESDDKNVAKSTGSMKAMRGLKRTYSRRNLFSNNRKISDYFSPA